jgi:sec-independent protein translocase protein TatB
MVNIGMWEMTRNLWVMEQTIFGFLGPIGVWEMTIILLAALLLLGPNKLPDFARWLGKSMREVRRATQEVKDAISMELEREELNRLRQDIEKDINQSLDTTALDPWKTPPQQEPIYMGDPTAPEGEAVRKSDPPTTEGTPFSSSASIAASEHKETVSESPKVEAPSTPS